MSTTYTSVVQLCNISDVINFTSKSYKLYSYTYPGMYSIQSNTLTTVRMDVLGTCAS